MLTEGLYLLDDSIATKQEEYLLEGHFLAYLQVTPLECLYEAFLFLLDFTGFNIELWDFVYSYSSGDYSSLIDLLLREYTFTPSNTSEVVEVFRGTDSGSTPLSNAFSWTTSYDIAHAFATMNGGHNASIYTATVDKGHIIRSLNMRNEQEIIVSPFSLINPKRIFLHKPYTRRELKQLLKDYSVKDIEHLMVILYSLGRRRDDILTTSELNWGELKVSLISAYGDFLSLSGSDFALLGERGLTPVLTVSLDLTIIESLRELNNYKKGRPFIYSKPYHRYIETFKKVCFNSTEEGYKRGANFSNEN